MADEKHFFPVGSVCASLKVPDWRVAPRWSALPKGRHPSQILRRAASPSSSWRCVTSRTNLAHPLSGGTGKEKPPISREEQSVPAFSCPSAAPGFLLRPGPVSTRTVGPVSAAAADRGVACRRLVLTEHGAVRQDRAACLPLLPPVGVPSPKDRKELRGGRPTGMVVRIASPASRDGTTGFDLRAVTRSQTIMPTEFPPVSAELLCAPVSQPASQAPKGWNALPKRALPIRLPGRAAGRNRGICRSDQPCQSIPPRSGENHERESNGVN